jgi:antibiotic biosynthesis monooxygenase (ABM) superfamily enzyme
MARIDKNRNILLADVSGHIGKKLVIKQYGDRIVVSKFPNMSKVKYTKMQKQGQSLFQRAVIFGRYVVSDPKKKKEFAKKAKKGQTAYHAAVSAFMRGEV